MGSLYEYLGVVSLELKTIATKEKDFISGLIWLLQLWLNATFELSLNVSAPTDLARRVEGTKLALLTPKDVDYRQVLRKYFFMYVNCATFVSYMAPFINRSHEPYWFRR